MKRREILLGIVVITLGVMMTATAMVNYEIGCYNKSYIKAATKSYGSNGTILYIYGTNKSLAYKWKHLLENHSYAVHLLPVDGLINVQYSNYDLIIVGDDAYPWNASDAYILKMSRRPVIGIGWGGYRCFNTMQLDIGIHTSTYSTYSQVVKVPKNLTVYKEPVHISVATGELQLYTQPLSVWRKVIYTPSINPRKYLSIANYYSYDIYSEIIQEDRFVYWSFRQAPVYLTEDGENLFFNIVYYLLENTVKLPYLQYPVTLDGNFTGAMISSEWIDAAYRGFDSYNYTYFKEDEDYLYIMMSVKNSSSSDYDFVQIFLETTNNRTVGTDIGCIKIILYEQFNGVRYSWKQYYTPPGDTTGWSSYYLPDGTNISAAWYITSDFLRAEVKIKKSYLNIQRNHTWILGFAIRWASGGYEKKLPSTMAWTDASSWGTLISKQHWKGQYEYVVAKYWYDASIDGYLESNEWYGASSYYKRLPSGYYFKIMFMHSEDRLYLGGYFTNNTTYQNLPMLYICFDCDANGGTAPQTDDFELVIGKSWNSPYLKEKVGTGSGWSAATNLTDGEGVVRLTSSTIYFEVALNFSKLNISAGAYKEIKISLRVWFGTDDEIVLPPERNYNVPDTWNVTLYSPNYWQYNVVDALDAPESLYDVTIDGNLFTTSYEWKDAYEYNIELPNGKTATLYIKNNNTHLLLGFSYYNPNPYPTTHISFYFDSHYTHTGNPQPEDYCFRVYYNGTLDELTGTGSGWTSTTPSGWVAATQNISNYWYIEVSIEYSKLGITPGTDEDVGIALYIYDYGRVNKYWPDMPTNIYLDKYNRLTSSNNWGSPPVPEINLIAILLLILPAMIAIVIYTTKNY